MGRILIQKLAIPAIPGAFQFLVLLMVAVVSLMLMSFHTGSLYLRVDPVVGSKLLPWWWCCHSLRSFSIMLRILRQFSIQLPCLSLCRSSFQAGCFHFYLLSLSVASNMIVADAWTSCLISMRFTDLATGSHAWSCRRLHLVAWWLICSIRLRDRWMFSSCFF